MPPPRNIRRSSQEVAKLPPRPRVSAPVSGAPFGGLFKHGDAVSPTPPPVAVMAREITAPRLRRGAPVRSPIVRPRRGLIRTMMLVMVATAMVATVVIRAMGGLPPRVVSQLRLSVSQLRMAGSLGEVAKPLAETVVQLDPATVQHDGYASIKGGVLFTPITFQPQDGQYDLLIHFHGNTRVVRESAELAGLNAAVAVINLGVGSAPYEDAYAEPGTFEQLLDEIDRAMVRRGLSNPKRRRIALSGWSAGYGSISTILHLAKQPQNIDVILISDGIHCGWETDAEGHRGLNPRQMGSFAKAARRAAAGDMLFSITHSAIDPREYASTEATASYLLEAVGGVRQKSDEELEHLNLVSVVGAVSRSREKTMEPTTRARVGEFHVRGYRGETAEHHMAHLFQIGATLLPELAERWANVPVPRPETVAANPKPEAKRQARVSASAKRRRDSVSEPPSGGTSQASREPTSRSKPAQTAAISAQATGHNPAPQPPAPIVATGDTNPAANAEVPTPETSPTPAAPTTPTVP